MAKPVAGSEKVQALKCIVAFLSFLLFDVSYATRGPRPLNNAVGALDMAQELIQSNRPVIRDVRQDRVLQ